jgi:hypothetical protein
MAVLDRWSRARAATTVVVFVTRNLDDADLRWLYGEIDDLVRRAGLSPVVVPCDEMGVCPQYRELARCARDLRAYFFGIRPWLRRRLCDEYRCRPDIGEADAAIDASFEAVQLAEERLRTANAMFISLQEGLGDLSDADDRLRGARAILQDARDSYAAALARYHRMWLSARGVRTAKSLRS